jgi:GNAT superfamily N-acetyltransferase
MANSRQLSADVKLDRSVSVRQALPEDAEAIANIHVASWRATYQGVISDATLAGLSVAQRAVNWRERLTALAQGRSRAHYTCFVAVNVADGVIGFADGGLARPLDDGTSPAPYDGELYAIYLEPGMTRHGTGARLVQAVTSQLAADGIHALIIWVLAANPSRGFYEALGGAPAFHQDTSIGDQTLVEVGFGWLDIHSVIARTAPSA